MQGTIWQFKLNRHDEPVTDPATDGGKPADDKLPQFTGDFDPERAARALASAREGEKAAKTQAQEALAAVQKKDEQLAAMLKAAGLNPDGTAADDPAAAAAELAHRVEAAEARAWTLGTRSAIYDQAADAGVNAKLVYNSDEFRGTLDDLVDQDPDSPAFRSAVLQKMRDYVEANPEYAGGKTATGPRPDPSQGRGGDNQPVDFRKADKATFDAELAKFGLRARSPS